MSTSNSRATFRWRPPLIYDMFNHVPLDTLCYQLSLLRDSSKHCPTKMHPFQLLTFAAFLHTAAGQWAAPHGFGGPAAFAPASPSHQSCGSQPLPSSAPVSSAGPLAGMIKHVAVISVDGMHASDIAKYLAVRPQAFIKTMLQTGYEYTNAFTSAPSDSFPGTVAQWSGATVSLR